MELVSGLRWQGQETGLAKDRIYPSVVRQRSAGKPQVSLPGQLEEMAGLGKWEEGWKESVKASVLHGSEKFVTGMLKEPKGDRREQKGMREKESLSLEWSRIVAAIAKDWKAPWEVVSRQRGHGVVGLAYYLGQRHEGMTLRELGKCMGEVEYPAVSVAIARFQNRLKTERSLQRRVKQIEKLLKVEM
jgi:hypothetical protein